MVWSPHWAYLCCLQLHLACVLMSAVVICAQTGAAARSASALVGRLGGGCSATPSGATGSTAAPVRSFSSSSSGSQDRLDDEEALEGEASWQEHCAFEQERRGILRGMGRDRAAEVRSLTWRSCGPLVAGHVAWPMHCCGVACLVHVCVAVPGSVLLL